MAYGGDSQAEYDYGEEEYDYDDAYEEEYDAKPVQLEPGAGRASVLDASTVAEQTARLDAWEAQNHSMCRCKACTTAAPSGRWGTRTSWYPWASAVAAVAAPCTPFRTWPGLRCLRCLGRTGTSCRRLTRRTRSPVSTCPSGTGSCTRTCLQQVQRRHVCQGSGRGGVAGLVRRGLCAARDKKVRGAQGGLGRRTLEVSAFGPTFVAVVVSTAHQPQVVP